VLLNGVIFPVFQEAAVILQGVFYHDFLAAVMHEMLAVNVQ